MLQLLRDKKSMTPREIWDAMDISKQGALDLLQPLIQAGLVKQVGSKKAGAIFLPDCSIFWSTVAVNNQRPMLPIGMPPHHPTTFTQSQSYAQIQLSCVFPAQLHTLKRKLRWIPRDVNKREIAKWLVKMVR